MIDVDAPASELKPLELADSSAVEVGDGVVAIGSPYGLEQTVTAGIVSALHRQITSPNSFAIDDAIQTDAAINHGNSGGPLLDMDGEVIGVNSQIESESGGNVGIGFAVPSNTVAKIADALITDGSVEHAYLGVAIEDTDGAEGATLAEVRSGTPAAEAGLQSGDVVTELDGESRRLGRRAPPARRREEPGRHGRADDRAGRRDADRRGHARHPAERLREERAMRKRTKLALGAGAALAVAGAGGAVAATQLSPSEESAAIVDDAAKQLGVTPERLSDALRQAFARRIDEARADGRLSQEEALRLKERLEAGELPLVGGPVHKGPGARNRGFGHALHFGLEAAAAYLGVTEVELRQALRGGRSLADVARAEGKPVGRARRRDSVREQTARLDEAVQEDS